jgi:hypothetical protein
VDSIGLPQDAANHIKKVSLSQLGQSTWEKRIVVLEEASCGGLLVSNGLLDDPKDGPAMLGFFALQLSGNFQLLTRLLFSPET